MRIQNRIPSVESLVGGVTDETVAICETKSATFFRGEKLLLDLSGERMEALRVGLCDQGSEVQGARLAQFLGRAMMSRRGRSRPRLKI